VLAKANRVIRPEEFRAVVRRGRRRAAPEAVYYRLVREGEPVRFGFIVSRAVGGAVQRNRLRRRMRAVGRELVDAGRSGEDVVVRALPGSAELSWSELSGRMRAELAR
jgi:ribonuclease P protein component